MSSQVHIHGVSRDAELERLKEAIEHVFLESTDQLSWLKPGDLVLLKPALNSPDPYPATTHPLSISVVADTLKKHGAKIVIGDQSGIEHVVHGPHGVVKGNSQTNFIKSGMSRYHAEKDFINFEQEGWDEGFQHFQTNQTSSWKNGFFATNWIQKADHIINLPRLSTHAQAGVTLGFKNMVGILREDSRLEFHANGPFNTIITKAAKGSGINVKDDETRKFIEKITEISLAVKEKLRLTLFTATQAQTTFGPDRSVFPGLRSYVATPETGLVFASADPVAAECFAIAFLTELYRSETPVFAKSMQRGLVRTNGRIRELGTQPIIEHPFIKHAATLGLGSTDFVPVYTDVPEELQKKFSEILNIS